MEEFKLKEREQIFRIKKMNAIEIFALRATMGYSDVKESMSTVNAILERIEVKFGEKWLPVKEGNTYYPNGIDNDYQAVEELVFKMNEYLKSVFQKSRESKE